jgi:hypothetical protein
MNLVLNRHCCDAVLTVKSEWVIVSVLVMNLLTRALSGHTCRLNEILCAMWNDGQTDAICHARSNTVSRLALGFNRKQLDEKLGSGSATLSPTATLGKS